MKQKTQFLRLLSFVLCIVLIATAALLTSGCNGKKEAEKDVSEAKVLGSGKTKFIFVAESLDSVETYEIHTDKKTVGDALLELSLISGDEGQFGLYVKTVCGKTYDYDKDGKYWAFYEDGKMAMAGVDVTEIKENSTYMLKAE